MKDRGLDDPDRLYYRPNSTRTAQVFASADLFQPGSAILTDAGRGLLDRYAKEFKDHHWPDSAEVVIAAFLGSAKDEAAARVLTQDQAKAVRTYFEQKYKLFDIAFFRQRKVAAVGFGTKAPRIEGAAADTADSEPKPPDRIEILVYTPKS
jgi:hypothetical protein